MKKRYVSFLSGIILGLLIGFFIGKSFTGDSHPAHTPAATAAQNENNHRASATVLHSNKNIPQKVYKVLRYVQSHGQPINGYVGGRKFSNREMRLPQQGAGGNAIQYREWDVNPKIRGQSRGPERLVTGSDGSAWYTKDHYKTFIRILP